jgi:hypothetical protein
MRLNCNPNPPIFLTCTQDSESDCIMIKYFAVPLLVLLMFLQGCLPDPDPVTQTINTYEFYYNYLTEAYDVTWEIDDRVIGTGHSYGVPAQAAEVLDSAQQEVKIGVRSSDSDLMIDTLSCLLYENGSFMVALLGNEDEPYLLCEPMDTRYPSPGMVKLRFLHAAATMDPVDIYIGGDLPENKALSGVGYTSVTEYLEFTEEALWNAIVITPANTVPADSTILSYTVNPIFQTGWVYLCIIGHSENSIESSYMLQVDDQPVY